MARTRASNTTTNAGFAILRLSFPCLLLTSVDGFVVSPQHRVPKRPTANGVVTPSSAWGILPSALRSSASSNEKGCDRETEEAGTFAFQPSGEEGTPQLLETMTIQALVDEETTITGSTRRSREPQRRDRDVGGYDPSERIGEGIKVGNPQIKVQEKERSVTAILKELAAIQQQGPRKYCILGTRHCSYLHQQIIELLAYALCLSGNHVYTSGAGGTHAATIRGALRAERQELLTVILPQSMSKQTRESQELLEKVDDVVSMPQNDELSLDIASRICNSYLLSQTDQLISFAFHDSTTVIEATKEAKKLDMLVTTLYLD